MTRYVVVNNAGYAWSKVGSLESQQQQMTKAQVEHSAIYELGPEVKEPDYGPLVEWVKERTPDHRSGACGTRPSEVYRDCYCGLTDALKAAGL